MISQPGARGAKSYTKNSCSFSLRHAPAFDDRAHRLVFIELHFSEAAATLLMMAHSARQWEPLRAQQMAQRNYWPQQAQGPPRQQPQLGVAAPAGRGSRTVRTCISSVPLFHTRERLPCERPAGRHVPPRTFPVSAQPGATYLFRHIPSLCAPSWAPRALDPSQSVSAQPGDTCHPISCAPSRLAAVPRAPTRRHAPCHHVLCPEISTEANQRRLVL